jgi:hypothetical protein
MAGDSSEVCQLCKGARWKIVGDKAQPCICLKLRMLQEYLGPEIGVARRIQRSPLYTLNDDCKSAKLDRTTENLFIKATWPTLLPHLRLALGHRYFQQSTFRFATVTDERVIRVYVGDESFKHRSSKVREDRENYNGLHDLVEAPDLVLVRLGYLAYKNAAAPGALKEALMIREAAHKPTWVIQNPHQEYPLSWNEEVAAYVVAHFAVVDLRETEESPGEDSSIGVEEVMLKPAAHKAAPVKQEPTELVPTDDSDPWATKSVGYKKPSRWQGPKKRGGDDSGGGMPPV